MKTNKEINKLMQKAKKSKEDLNNLEYTEISLEEFIEKKGDLFYEVLNEDNIVFFKKLEGKLYKFGNKVKDTKSDIFYEGNTDIPEEAEEIIEEKTPQNINEWINQANIVIKNMSKDFNNKINILNKKIDVQEANTKEMIKNMVNLINPIRKKLKIKEIKIK